MTRMIRRETAARYARTAQAACAVLAVAAVAVAGLGFPGKGANDLATLPDPGSGAAKGTKALGAPPSAAEGVNFDGIGQRLALIDNAPKPAPPAPLETSENPVEVAKPVEQGVKFLGAIIEPTRRVALVSVNGKQRMLAAGQSLKLGTDEHADTLQVVSVDDDAVTIEDKGGRRRIDKSVRSGPAITTVASAAVAGTEAPRGAEQPQSQMNAAIKRLRDLAGNQRDNPELQKQIRELRRSMGDSQNPRRGRNEGSE